MKNKKILSLAAFLAVMALLGGSALAVKAANSDNSTNSFFKGNNFGADCPGKGAWKNNNRPELTTTQIEEMKAKRAEMEAAIKSGNYDTWVAVVKAHNSNSPLLNKINATNFSRYVELYNLKNQAAVIEQELGFKAPGDFGFGMGQGPGHRFAPEK